MTDSLKNPSVIKTAQRLQETLGVKVEPQLNNRDEVQYTIAIPKEKDSNGKVVSSMGVANQVENALNESLNEGSGFFKKTFAAEKTEAFVYTGRGNAMTRDLAIPADKAEQVIKLAEKARQKDPEVFKNIFPKEMHIQKTEKENTGTSATKDIAIPAKDKALLATFNMKASTHEAASPGHTAAQISTRTKGIN